MGYEAGAGEIAALQREVSHLRAELARAAEAVRAAEQAAGELRGELIECYRVLDHTTELERRLRATYSGRALEFARGCRRIAGRLRRTLLPGRAG